MNALADARRRLSRALELNDRFQVCFVFGPQPQARDFISAAVADAAARRAEPINLLWFLPQDAAALVERSGDEPTTVWTVECPNDDDKATALFQRLNRTRDSMGTHPRTTLIVHVPHEHQQALFREAPDLWSIRTFSESIARETPRIDLDAWSRSGRDARERIDHEPTCRAAYARGYYALMYAIDGVREVASLAAFSGVLDRAVGLTSIRPWSTAHGPPTSRDAGTLEHWRGVARGGEYWRADQRGLFYLSRPYEEDVEEQPHITSLGLPIWRVGEALDHAAQMAEALATAVSTTAFRAEWTGLRDREASLWPGVGGTFGSIKTSREEVVAATTTTAEEIREDLPAIVRRLVQPLFDAFIVDIPDGFIERNINELRRTKR